MFPNKNYAVDNLEIHGPHIRLSGVKTQDSTTESDWGYDPVPATWGNMVAPNYLAPPPPTFDCAMPVAPGNETGWDTAQASQSFHPPVTDWPSMDTSSVPSPAISLAEGMSFGPSVVAPNYLAPPPPTFHGTMPVAPGNETGGDTIQASQPPVTHWPSTDTASVPSPAFNLAEATSLGRYGDLQYYDELFAEIIAQRERENEANHSPHKRRRELEPEFSNKMLIIEGEETGVRTAVQRGEPQELSVRRTPASIEMISKLGHRGLVVETLVVPPQGVSPLQSLGPTITGATPGAHEYAAQAWTKEGEESVFKTEAGGVEDAHDEEETDKARCNRLMREEGGVWKCMGCGGKPFSDRCTLRRHCKSAVHGKRRDMRKCRYCPKEYQRPSGLTRHVRKEHPGVEDEGGKGEGKMR